LPSTDVASERILIIDNSFDEVVKGLLVVIDDAVAECAVCGVQANESGSAPEDLQRKAIRVPPLSFRLRTEPRTDLYVDQMVRRLYTLRCFD